MRAVSSWGGRKPLWGRALVCLGWALRVLGMFALFASTSLVRDPAGGLVSLPLWSRLLIMFAVMVVGGALLHCGGPVLVRGKQHRANIITSFDELAGVRYLLYLRPFSLDSHMALPPSEAPGALMRSPFEVPGLTNEDFLTRQFSRLGKVVAIGQPGEHLPLIGAARGYLPVDDWQDQVSALIRGAHVVMMSAAPGPGTVWEFTEALRILAPTRLVLLVYCDSADYDAFRATVAREYAARSVREPATTPTGAWPSLPRFPDLPVSEVRAPRGRTWDTALKGMVVFDEEWRTRFVRFDLEVPQLRSVWTIRRLVRRELKPVLELMSHLPPPQPPEKGRRPL